MIPRAWASGRARQAPTPTESPIFDRALVADLGAEGTILRVLVTGAAGYVGRHLCDRLRGAGVDVVGLIRRPANGMTVPCRTGDLADEYALERVLEGVDVVIHSAARVGVGTSAEFERDNVTATRNLAAALDGRRLLHLSTVQVYGTRSLVDAEESCPVDSIVETHIFEYHGEKRGDLYFTKDMLLAVGDRYEREIAAHKAADAKYR